jgi:hypothetical protein
MSFTSEDVADDDIPPHPYFTVRNYVERVRALGLSLALVAAIVAYADPAFAPFVGSGVQSAAGAVVASFDSVSHAYQSALVSWSL